MAARWAEGRADPRLVVGPAAAPPPSRCRAAAVAAAAVVVVCGGVALGLSTTWGTEASHTSSWLHPSAFAATHPRLALPAPPRHIIAPRRPSRALSFTAGLGAAPEPPPPRPSPGPRLRDALRRPLRAARAALAAAAAAGGAAWGWLRHGLLVLLLTLSLWVGPAGGFLTRLHLTPAPALASPQRRPTRPPEPLHLNRDAEEEAEKRQLLPPGKGAGLAAATAAVAKDKVPPHQEHIERGRNAWDRLFNPHHPRRERRLTAAEIDPATDLRAGPRHVAIFTTAALPWMTGTSINPLLRAVYLAKQGLHDVTLVIPWLAEPGDQARLFPKKTRFDSPEQQEAWIRHWLVTKAGVSPEDAAQVRLKWYPARYSPLLGSVFHRQVMVDLTSDKVIPDEEADVAILEEPEHLNWFHHGGRWTDHFNHVVGIVHTNYLEYSQNDTQRDFLVSAGQPVVTSLLTQITCQYTDVNVKLSAVLMKLPRDRVCNVNGVQPRFLEIGRKVEEAMQRAQAADPETAAPAPPVFTKGAYFLGKALWAKGFSEFLDIYGQLKDRWPGELDLYGSGEDAAAIRAAAEAAGAPFHFHDGIDHASDTIQQYKVFVNPSKSEVLCTATAEALAMGKVCVIAKHSSNTFFEQFPNVYTFSNAREFREQLQRALADDPRPLNAEDRYTLSWEAATERLLDSVALPKRAPGEPRPALSAEANLAYLFHYALGMEPVGDLIRDAVGSGAEVPWEERPWHPSQTAKLLEEAKASAKESAAALDLRLQEQVEFTKQYTEESTRNVQRRLKEQTRYAKKLVDSVEEDISKRLRQLEEDSERFWDRVRASTAAGAEATKKDQLQLFRQEWIQEWLSGQLPDKADALDRRPAAGERPAATAPLSLKEVYDRAVDAWKRQWAVLTDWQAELTNQAKGNGRPDARK